MGFCTSIGEWCAWITNHTEMPLPSSTALHVNCRPRDSPSMRAFLGRRVPYMIVRWVTLSSCSVPAIFWESLFIAAVIVAPRLPLLVVPSAFRSLWLDLTFQGGGGARCLVVLFRPRCTPGIAAKRDRDSRRFLARSTVATVYS